MLQIDNTIISLDLLEERFACNLLMCKGICCVEGDAGAPLEAEEIEQLNSVLPVVWEQLPKPARQVIRQQGVSYIDDDGEPVTSIVNNKECVFAYREKNGIWKCAIEKAYRDGKTDFYKPISCHLYPVRLQKYETMTAVNVHRWKICESACANGKKQNIPVYQFLKTPLIRHFGEAWYEQLATAAVELQK